MISITKKIEFEAAHRLSNHAGDCRQIHGHTYKLEVTISGQVQANTDMVLDFKVLKEILKSAVLAPFDHTLILKDNLQNRQDFAHYTGRVTWLPSEPTAERMALFLADSIGSLLPASTRLETLRLFETSNSYATWQNIRR